MPAKHLGSVKNKIIKVLGKYGLDVCLNPERLGQLVAKKCWWWQKRTAQALVETVKHLTSADLENFAPESVHRFEIDLRMRLLLAGENEEAACESAQAWTSVFSTLYLVQVLTPQLKQVGQGVEELKGKLQTMDRKIAKIEKDRHVH